MDRLDFVLRRYKQILPKPVQWADMPMHDLGIWLKEDVSTLLDDYARRPAFRENASWPVRSFRPGAATEERTIVNGIDSALVDCGKALSRFADERRIKQALKELFPATKRPIREEVLLDGKSQKILGREHGTFFETDELHHQALAIAKHGGWSDLVNINDYFEPEQQWVTLDDGTRLQSGEMIVSVNPDLLPAGNFIVRCLLKRISWRKEALEKYRRMCLRALSKIRSKYKQSHQKLESSWEQLSRLTDDLTCTLRTGPETRLRDACVAATQIYAAFHARPDLGWLGLSDKVVTHGGHILRARSTGLQNAYFFDRIAVALGELRHLYQDDSPASSNVEEAIASGGLVIDEESGEAYWHSTAISISAKGRQWKLLVALARKGQRAAIVEIGDLYGDNIVTDNAISTTWNRLKGTLPASFHKYVQPGPRPATYRLTLEPHLIHVFTAAKRNARRDS